MIHSGNFIRLDQIYWGTSGNTTQAKFTTMFLLTIFNPCLTMGLRSTGFEGGSLPRYALYNTCRQNRHRQTACMQDKTEYLVMFHGREDSVKSTNVARNRRMSTDSNSQLERTAGKMAVPYSSFSRHRVRTPSSACSGPTQCR